VIAPGGPHFFSISTERMTTVLARASALDGAEDDFAAGVAGGV
jgi:hypothetical protein